MQEVPFSVNGRDYILTCLWGPPTESGFRYFSTKDGTRFGPVRWSGVEAKSKSAKALYAAGMEAWLLWGDGGWLS